LSILNVQFLGQPRREDTSRRHDVTFREATLQLSGVERGWMGRITDLELQEEAGTPFWDPVQALF
jgi:hypothetical protein